ncbi:Do family serine endopeptidase [Methylobacterium frigidaeris]|uniref:Probable periplasmic serine endoprotease DegP-like n=1 Tax=Methylobacterium frigidaeris TaxID=2038277 RepID=A0AA37M3A8_9HYPH|nr:Do family serine endopeptidase [Methylobacterium frigidaeris]PIK74422.1 serine peptidase [Methylobacterium frigidaeris]GJD60579.1 Periplasmic serine endoprotease DegP [Methylobacterium frigidaeris]
MSQTTETSATATRRFHRKALASVAAVTLVATGALGTAFVQPSTPAYAQALPQTPITTAEHPPGSFAPIVNRVKPGVVSVKVKLKDDASDDEDGGGRPNLQNVPPQLREFFRRFGEGGPGGMQAPQRHGGGAAQGSGFFISADGYVVTNNHVVNNAKSVEVTLDDGRTLPAKIIGTDPKTDLALLKVTEGAPFPYVKLAHGAPQVGDWVVAIGNPFGLGGTVTAGIVSARGRDIGAGPYDDFLQIDAPINKGNSGGPTFNVSGEVVGVNTAIASPSGGNVGLAFAIPSETVQAVVDQLRADGKVARGYLGLQIQPVTKDIADSLGLDKAKGALVTSAQDGTPAAKAGLKSGDVVQAVNGDPVTDARELSRKIASLKPGTKVDLTYLRGGRTETAQVTLGTLPNDTKVASLDDRRGGRGDSQPRLGLSLAPAGQVGAGQEGVAVVGVDPDGPAAAKGIQEGDIILDVGGQPVSNLSDVATRIRAAESDGRKAVLMRIKNDKGTRFVAIGLQSKNG